MVERNHLKRGEDLTSDGRMVGRSTGYIPSLPLLRLSPSWLGFTLLLLLLPPPPLPR